MAKGQKGAKAAKEAEERAKHLQSLREAKARRRNEPMLVRREAVREDIPKILIVCEGRNTEPSYFEQFKLATAEIVVFGEGNNTISLVHHAEKLSAKGDYAQIWCVFDRDSFPAEHFNNAINKALSLGFEVAYSNQAFEYWLILHFDDHQGGGMARTDYHDKINGLLAPFGIVYDGKGSKTISRELFDLTLEIIDGHKGKRRLDVAIARAERNYDRFDHANPAAEESSTTVFRLVRELLKYV